MEEAIAKINTLGYLSTHHLIPIIDELKNSSLETQINFFREHSSSYKFAPIFDKLFLCDINFRLHPEIGNYYHDRYKKFFADMSVLKIFLDAYPERDVNDYIISDGLIENIDYLIEKSYFFNNSFDLFGSIYESLPYYSADNININLDTSLRKIFEYISKIKSREQIIKYLNRFIEKHFKYEVIITQLEFGLDTKLDNYFYHLLMYLNEICCINLFKIDSFINHVPVFFSYKMNRALMYLLDIGLMPEHVSLNLLIEDSKFDKLRDRMFVNGFSDKTVGMIEAIYKLNPNTSAIRPDVEYD